MNTQKQHEEFWNKHWSDELEFDDIPALDKGTMDMMGKIGIAAVLVLVAIVGLIGWGLWSIISTNQ